MKLDNLNIVVTGGASGIGKCIVENLMGSNNIFVADIIKENPFISQGKRVNYYCCDVSDPDSVESFFNQIYSEEDKIDVLINNAGLIFSAPLINPLKKDDRKHTLSDWRRVIAINLDSVFLCGVNYVNKQIKNRNPGLIINFTSISGNGAPHQTAYAAAKAGVMAITSTWSKELTKYGIRCAAISPGIVDSPSTDRDLKIAHKQYWKNAIPMHRFASMDEIAHAIKFIIENDYFNGKALRIDGGLEY